MNLFRIFNFHLRNKHYLCKKLITMSPKEKAKELFDKFIEYVPADVDFEHRYAISCSLIACEEIINSKPIGNSLEYWQEVKQEILNLK